MILRPLFLSLSVFAATGCASVPPPTARLATSEAAVRAADELKANETPAAQFHLKLAQDQLTEAKALVEKGENERATMLLVRSEADAELAVTLAKETVSAHDAKTAQGKVQKLKTQ